MIDRKRRRQNGSAGLPITIVLWCLSAGGVATFVAPSFEDAKQAEYREVFSQVAIEPVTQVIPIDDRRGLRRSLTELLPDYVVELAEAPKLASVDTNVEPASREVDELVKSVGQPAPEPAYPTLVGVAPAINPVLEVVASEPATPAVQRQQVVVADSRPEQRDESPVIVAPAHPSPDLLAETATAPIDVERIASPEPANETPQLTANVALDLDGELLTRVTERLRGSDHAGAYQLFRERVRSGRGVSWTGRALELYAISALGAGAYREAALSYERLIDAEPEASKWWLGLAASRQAIGQDASELFARAAELGQPSQLVARH
ncbi:MAG: hypothetical protein NXH85_09335 [Pseudomonadaceae bacterium]|nr:hypothetical protein [Pseudomonadaceae bacterium]